MNDAEREREWAGLMACFGQVVQMLGNEIADAHAQRFLQGCTEAFGAVVALACDAGIAIPPVEYFCCCADGDAGPICVIHGSLALAAGPRR
jgi:hypothetical protein